jgi:hypothetical protein
MYFFPHIPKAGGTTLRNLFYQAFGTDNCLRVWNPKAGAQVSANDFETYNNIEDYSVILGHLPIDKFLKNSAAKSKIMRGEIEILTAVRDPIDRLISLYNFIRVNPKHPMHGKLQNIAAVDFLFSQEPNFQIRFLSKSPAKSISSVLTSMTVFPLEQSITLLKKHLEDSQEITLNDIEPKNRTADRPGASNLFKRDMLSHGQLERLSKTHDLDLQLYHRSQRTFESNILS